MPAPLVLSPLAMKAIGYGTVAALALYAARWRRGPASAQREDALDGIEEGVEVHRASSPEERRWLASGRLRRVIRTGPDGPGIEIDFSTLARLRVRPVRRGQ